MLFTSSLSSSHNPKSYWSTVRFHKMYVGGGIEYRIRASYGGTEYVIPMEKVPESLPGSKSQAVDSVKDLYLKLWRDASSQNRLH